MPYTITFELMKGRTNSAQKEDATGTLKLVHDIRATGMKIVSIKHSSGHDVPVDELTKLVRSMDFPE